ncbi:MAG: cytochrome c oxidase subunit 3 family protein [Acidobacteriaceae bacterium]|nr:cytochrome c oxidase subunit 3 family protein [Acidobacteriaceae bacterium]
MSEFATEPAVTTVGDTVLELREQYASPPQQRETASIGMWVFLASEVLLFGALFSAFTVYRLSHPYAFDAGSAHMEFLIGGINTGILICSSFTMALAVHSSEEGKQKFILLYLAATMILGAIFLALKFTEYYLHYEEHKFPAFWFEYSGPHAPQVQMFFVFYFIMTGLHALHMTIGIGILGVLFFRTLLGRFNAAYHTPIEIGGLYWHFIDVVWVFLYAIFYIPGLHAK